MVAPPDTYQQCKSTEAAGVIAEHTSRQKTGLARFNRPVVALSCKTDATLILYSCICRGYVHFA